MSDSSFRRPVTDTSSGAGDHRVWLRFPSRMSTTCHSAAGDNEWLVQVHDVSRRGLKLLSTHKFEQGTTVNIGNADDDAGKAPVIVARVVNVSAAPEGKWDVDCAYLKELSESDLLAWLKKKN
jgi:PilZ domain